MPEKKRRPLTGPCIRQLLALHRTGTMPLGMSGSWMIVDALVERGLIRVELGSVGTAAKHVLTDRGREWCEQNGGGS